MKCPLRTDPLGNFGDCYMEGCAWWKEGCIVLEIATKEEHARAAPKLQSNKLFTVGEVANILNMKQDRIYSLAREKILPSVSLGRQLRFSGPAIEKFIDEGGKKYAGGWKREED